MKKVLFPVLALVLALGLALPMVAVVGAADDDPLIFGMQRYEATIYGINPLDGTTSTTIDTGLLGSKVGPNGLAYDSDNDILYWVTYYESNPEQVKLCYWDKINSTYVRIFDGLGGRKWLPGDDYVEHADGVTCADFYDGKYYYIPNWTDDLYAVTISGDTVTQIDEFPGISGGDAYEWSFGGDIAIAPDGVIYGVGDSTREAGGLYHFFSVNRDGTGFTMIDDDVHDFSLQLAFGLDGTLYGHESQDDGNFYVIDTDTGGLGSALPNATKHLYTDLSSGPRGATVQEVQICGVKYADWEGDEIALPGWTISLEKWDPEANEEGGWVPLADAVTDENGSYCFDELEDGEYKVSETLKEGWDQVSPANNEHLVTLPDDEESYDFHNTPTAYCFDETAWAAQENPGEDRFVGPPGNWATFVTYTKDQAQDFPLYAGQTHEAGTLRVWDDGNNTLFVEYVASGEDGDFMEGYCEAAWTGLTEYHLQVVDQYVDFQDVRTYSKKKGYGAPIPGQFDETWEGDKLAETEPIEVSIEGFEGEILIAAHAVMWWCGYDCDALAEIEAALEPVVVQELVGHWSLEYWFSGGGFAAGHEMSITEQDQYGSFAGTGYSVTGSSWTWNVEGTITDSTVSMTIIYDQEVGGTYPYIVELDGNVLADGSMAGDATDNREHSFTWTAI